MLLLEILTICSLISAPPFYDCSDTWEIHLYSEPPDIQCNNNDPRFHSFGCANLRSNTIHMVDFAEHTDRYGYSILQHELEHLKCQCDFHEFYN